MKAKDHPGVVIPPPMIYAAIFGLAQLVEKMYPLENRFFKAQGIHYTGWLFICLTLAVLLPALWRFLRSRNTLITIKPANSLQTTGIYAYTRNPMYLGLLLLYAALSCFSGNCWTFVFMPFLFLIIRNYMILREEKYLERAFKEEYIHYKNRVRRWI